MYQNNTQKYYFTQNLTLRLSEFRNTNFNSYTTKNKPNREFERELYRFLKI